MRHFVLPLLALSLAATPVLAKPKTTPETGPYIGTAISYTDTETSSDGSSASANPLAAHIKAGTKLHRWYGVEARAGLGIDDDVTGEEPTVVDGVTQTIEFSTEIETFQSLYAVGYLPNSSNFTPYGLLGISSVDLAFNQTDTAPIKAGGEGLSYGIGLEYELAYKIKLYAEYVVVFDGDIDTTIQDADGANINLELDTTVANLSLGISYHF